VTELMTHAEMKPNLDFSLQWTCKSLLQLRQFAMMPVFKFWFMIWNFLGEV